MQKNNIVLIIALVGININSRVTNQINPFTYGKKNLTII